jgi:hypothetical protein
MNKLQSFFFSIIDLSRYKKLILSHSKHQKNNIQAPKRSLNKNISISFVFHLSCKLWLYSFVYSNSFCLSPPDDIKTFSEDSPQQDVSIEMLMDTLQSRLGLDY